MPDPLCAVDEEMKKCLVINVSVLARNYRRLWFSMRAGTVIAVLMGAQIVNLGLISAFNRTLPPWLLVAIYLPMISVFGWTFYRWTGTFSLAIGSLAIVMLIFPIATVGFIIVFLFSIEELDGGSLMQAMLTIRFSVDTVGDVLDILNYWNVWPVYFLLMMPGCYAIFAIRIHRFAGASVCWNRVVRMTSRLDRVLPAAPLPLSWKRLQGVLVLFIASALMLVIPMYWIREAVIASDSFEQFIFWFFMVFVNFVFQPHGALAFFAVSAVAVYLYRLGRRLVQPSAMQVLVSDVRKTVLLLRSFSDDGVAIWPKLIWAAMRWQRRRLEEVIADHFSGVGPLIAVGTPGERLPQLGASRAYLANSDWQAEVKSWMADSQLILVVAGHTRWVAWELSELSDQSYLLKTIVVMPPSSSGDMWDRIHTLRGALAKTEYATALSGLDPVDLLAILFGPAGSVIAIKGHMRDEVEYQIAMLLAVHLRSNWQPTSESPTLLHRR